MTNKLYVIGTGPGDPGLMTLKAAKILSNAGLVFAPRGRDNGESLVLSMAREYIA
jgi:precorrin-2/cobalt-factor-2 C20-methyltransferase